jgi:hypothetical protein
MCVIFGSNCEVIFFFFLFFLLSVFRSVNRYEAPNERKTMDKAQRSLADVERLELVVEEEIASLMKQYERQCLELGIQPTGKDPLCELEGLGANIPAFCDSIVVACRVVSVKKAVDYYRAFARYVAHVLGAPSAEALVSSRVLQVLIERGNVLRADLNNVVQAKKKTDEWEIEDVSETEQTLLSAADSRAECLDDLHELAAFLNGRLREKIAADPALVGLQDTLILAADCPELVRSSDSVEQLTLMRDAIAAVIALIESAQFSRLMEIVSSKAFVDRLAASVRKRLELIDGAKERRLMMKDRRQNLTVEITKTRQRQADLVARERRLKVLLQEAIGKKFTKRCQIE